MSTSAPDPYTLLPELIAELNINIQWARRGGEGSRLEDLAECMEAISGLYRAMAICLLSVDADENAFFHWLLHSPLTRRHHLRRLHTEAAGKSRFARASSIDPVLDALAARQWLLAREIGELSSPDWMPGEEYEDDFCYGEFIRRMARGQDHGSDVLLARWRDVLEGGRDPRLDVADALVAGDAAGFVGNLLAMLEEREARAAEMANPRSRSVLASELTFYPNRWISVEGVALLAIAEARGIVVPDEVQGCPRWARAGSYEPFRVLGYPNQGLD